MKVLCVPEAGVRALLPMRECIGLMRQALTALAKGDAVLPLRTMVRLPDDTGLLGVMPGYLGEPRSFGLKIVSVFHGNHGSGFDSHQGVVVLFGLKHGQPLAVMDAGAITAIRTAAASGLATDILARTDAGDLAVLGSGTQARTHLEAMACVRTLRRVRVWSRTRANAERFARENAGASPVPIEVVESAVACVLDADLICTATASREPIVQGRWLRTGAHINAVGACFPASRELDGDAVRRGRLYTDARESCVNEAGDYRLALAEGAITESHLLGELGEVLTGKVPGRQMNEEITIYESLGIALEDLASAHFIHARARASGSGVWLEWGGPSDG